MLAPATELLPVSTSTPLPALTSAPPAVLVTLALSKRSSRAAASLTVTVWADPLRSSAPPTWACVPNGLTVRAVVPTRVSVPAPASISTVPPLRVRVFDRASLFPVAASSAPSVTVVAPNVSVPPSRVVAKLTVVPPVVPAAASCATFVFASAPVNTTVNGPPLAP